jgi:hypothetical protein
MYDHYAPALIRADWLRWQQAHPEEAQQIKARFADQAVRNFAAARDLLAQTIANRVDAPRSAVDVAMQEETP